MLLAPWSTLTWGAAASQRTIMQENKALLTLCKPGKRMVFILGLNESLMILLVRLIPLGMDNGESGGELSTEEEPPSWSVLSTIIDSGVAGSVCSMIEAMLALFEERVTRRCGEDVSLVVLGGDVDMIPCDWQCRSPIEVSECFVNDSSYEGKRRRMKDNIVFREWRLLGKEATRYKKTK